MSTTKTSGPGNQAALSPLTLSKSRPSLSTELQRSLLYFWHARQDGVKVTGITVGFVTE